MQWFICEYVTVGVHAISSMASGWHAGLDKGGFPLLLPFSQHLPVWHISTSVNPWFLCPAPQTMARESPPQALLVCIAAFWVLAECGGACSMNVFLPLALYSELIHTGEKKIIILIYLFFVSICGKQWTCLTETEQSSLSTQSLYEVSRFGVSHEGRSVTVNQGLSPR